MGVIERTKGVERDDDEESVYMYSSRPTTPGDRKGLLVRFQLVSRTQPCVAHHYMSVNLNTRLSELRRPVNTHFKEHFEGGFIFLCKTKEIIKNREKQLTIFDILPKLPNITPSDSSLRGDRRKRMPSDSFLYPGVQYKELSYDVDGTRHLAMCACVVFLFERSKVSHWPPDKLQEELSAGMLEGFSFIPSDIMSWKEKLVESRATTIHGYAACNQKKELETAIHQLPEFAYVQNIRDQRGAVPLHYAAENGHLEICEILVAAIGRDLIYQQDVNQKTPLHCALYRRKMNTSVYLLQLNSDLVRPDVYGNSCMDLLLQQSSKDMDFVISKLQIECVDDVLKYHLTRFVMKKGNKKLSKKLTERVTPCAGDTLGEDLLHIAADMGEKEIVEQLISNKFELSKRDLNEYLPFHRACAKGNKEIARLLFYPDMKDSDICRGVTLAVKQKCYEICSEMRAKKPSLVLDESSVCTITQHLDTILKKVSKDRKAREKELKDCENTLKNVAPLLQKEEGVLETYVYDCARHNLPDALILLKSLGVGFNDRDFMGRSPLHEAAEHDSCKAINILLKGKSNPNAVDWRGGSPIHYACAKGHLQSVTLLMNLGQKIEAGNQNASGRTPLLEAAYSRKFEVVQYLVSNHSNTINIRATDGQGQSILHFLVGIPDKMDKIVDLVLAKYLSVEKTDTGKYFKRTLWTDSVKHSAWSRHVIASLFRATTSVGDLVQHYTDSKTGEQLKGPFNNGFVVASWNSRTDGESTESLKLGKSPRKEMNECTRCRDFVGKQSKYREPHRCTLAGIQQHEGEGKIRKIVQRAFKHHYVFQQDVISPVFNAVKTGNVILVKKLLKFDPGYINERDNFGRSLIELAIDQGFVKLVQHLLDLQPSQPNPGLVYRVLMQKKKSKSDNMRKALLSSLIAKGHFTDKRLETRKVSHDGCSIRKGKFCHRQCYLKGYTPLEVVVRNNDEDLFKLVLDKSSGKHKAISLLLAAYKGRHAMLETIKKKTYSQKKDKNEEEDDDDDDDKEEEEIDERVLLDIACRSPHISVDLIKVISKLYPEMLEENTEGILTDHPRRRRYLQFDIPKQSFSESSSLGKLLSAVYYDKGARLLHKSKIEDNACQLIAEGINLGKIFHSTHSSRRKDNSFTHGCCECLLTAMEGKFYGVAERILQKNASTIWKCATGSEQCQFQRTFKKRMLNQKTNHMHEPQYIDYILVLACSEAAPRTILQLLLQNGFNEFDANTIISLDDMDETARSEVEKIKDPFLQKLVYITQLLAIQRKGRPDVYKLIRLIPKMMTVLEHIDHKLFKQPRRQNEICSFIQMCCCLSMNGRCGYDIKMVCNKQQYVPVDLPEGLSLLHMVCALENVEHVKDLVKCGTDVDINIESTNGIRAVDVAASCGNWPVFKFLLDQKAEVNSNTLLACCAQERHKGMHHWIDRLHAVYGKTPVVEKQRLRIIKELCSRHDTVDPLSHSQDTSECPLGAALQSKFWGVAEYLCTLTAGAAVIPMLQAISKNSKPEWALEVPKDLIRMIVEASMKHSSSPISGQSSSPIAGLTHVLQTITKRSDFKLVESIIKQLDVSMADDDKWLEMCRETDTHDMTILHYLSQIGHACAIETILKRLPSYTDRKAVINTYDYAEASALWYALANKQWSTGTLLLTFGANGDTLRAIPDFEPKRSCSSEKQKIQDKQDSKLNSGIQKKGVRAFPSVKNDSEEVSLCFVPSSVFYTGKKKDIPAKVTNPISSSQVTEHLPATDPDKTAVKRLLRLAQAADAAGCDIIHAACGTGNTDLLREILRLQPNAFNQKDEQGNYPFAYAIIGGKQEVLDLLKENMTSEIAVNSLEPFIWKLASSEKGNKLRRAFSQLLGHICVNPEMCKEEEEIRKSAKQRLSPFRWGDFSSLWLEKKHTYGSFLQEDGAEKDSIDQVIEHIDVLHKMLLCRHPLDSFLYLNPRADLPDECAKSLLTLLFTNMKDIDSGSILSLVMIQKSWILKELMENNATRDTFMTMNKQILWKYSIVDCLFIFANPDDERLYSEGGSQQKIDKHVKEMMNRYNLTLSPGIGTLAVHKNLWCFLEHALFQTFENEGRLSDEWHSILATGAERGQLPFLRSILDKLHIPRMTADQRSCFTAYLCLACMAGKTDVVKYLLRHNVPTVGSMDEYPIRDILGKYHKKSWNILHYVFYSRSESTLKEILSVLKTERDFLKNLQVDECIVQSGKTARPGIVNQMVQFLSMTKNEGVLRKDWDTMLQIASRNGHEDLCIYLIEKQSANVLTSDNDNMSPLHYCGSFGMEKLAAIIVEREPSALERVDSRGLTPKDYAHALGQLQLFKGAKQTLKQQAPECDGWLRCLLQENALIQQNSNEGSISPHVFSKKRNLTLKNLLLRSDDHASENIIRWSSQEFIRMAAEEPQKCAKYFMLAAFYKCNKALRVLCDILQTSTDNTHNLQSLLLRDGHVSETSASRNRDQYEERHLPSKRGNGLTPLGWAICSQNKEGVDILMEKETCLTWRDNFSLENILHLAVKTENVSIVNHVNDKTDGKLTSEEDRQKTTPLAVAVALGLHRVFRILTKNKLKSISSSHEKHTGTRMDYGCADCLLDHCIGWSKNYLNGDFEMTLSEEEEARIIFQKKNNRGYVLKRLPVRYVSKIPFSVRHLCELNEEDESYHLHKIHCISALGGPNSKLVKSALFSMGYKVNEEVLQWITLRSITDPFEAAKKAVRAGYNGLAVKFIPQLNDEQALDVFETAAVNGKAYLFEQCQERLLSVVTKTVVNKSLVESSVAFGQIALGIRLLRLIQTSGNTEQFDVFRDIIQAIPQKICWLMEDQIPGNDQWLSDTEQGDRFTLPDLWLSMDETDPLRQYVEEKINVDNLLPETFKGRKFVPDKESFRRHSYFKEKGDIWIRCFIFSSQIFGHVCDVLNIDDPKAASVNTIKIACLPPGSSDHPKMCVETSGVLTNSIAVTMHNETPVLQHDPSLILRSKESSLKDTVLLEIIPAMEEKIMNAFGMPIKIRVDWNSIETRKRTTGSETIMKTLTGDNFQNELGGLQDVLADCITIKDTIENLFNEETVKLALKPVAGIKYITVTFVDSISNNDGQKKSRIPTPDSNVLWNFSMDRSALKYDRTTFPLWFHLNRYRTACVAFCDSIYRISHHNPLSLIDETVNWFETRKKRSVTLEMEWSSFQTTDEAAFMELVGHGIARELQVMASETEAMLRLTINSDHVTVKNSASSLYTGITFDTHGKNISASVYAHQTAKKAWVVEEGRTAVKLGDLEDRQLSNGSWQKDVHSMVEESIAKTRKEVVKRFGFNIEILFDEKRIFAPLLLKCRREIEHPHIIIERSMNEFLENLIVLYDKAMFEIFSGLHTSYSIFMQELDVHSGIWKDYSKRNGKNSKQTKELVIRKYKSDHSPINSYADNFKMQQLSQNDTEDQTIVSQSYEFMYPTSRLMDRSHNDNAQHVRFVSCNGRMYEIIDQNALMRALYKLPTKAVMGHDVLDILDLFGSERLFIKLFPTLVKDIQTSSKSATIPLIYDSLYRINCLHGVRHIRNIAVNWDDLFDSNNTSPDDRVRKVLRIIGALENTMEEAYIKRSLPCNMVARNPNVSNKSLMKISSLHLSTVSEDFKPDSSVVRIVQPKEKGQPHLHVRSGNVLTVAYQNFKNIAAFHDIFLTAVVHVLELEVKTHIEKGIAKNPEKDKWRRKQYDGPKLTRPSLCYVERVLPRILSSLSEIMNTTEGKECLLTHFFDFQFAKAESNKTTVEMDEGWLICFLSPEDMGANIGSLLMSALYIKTNGSISPVLHHKGPGLHFASKEENTLKVVAAHSHGNLLKTMCDTNSFTIKLWTKNKKQAKSVNPYEVVMDEKQQAIQVKWKRDDELPSDYMGHAQLMYRDVSVGSQVKTYLCENIGMSTEKLTDGGGIEIQKGGNVLVIVEHDPQCHVQGRHDLTAANQKTVDIQNGISIQTIEEKDFLIKMKKKTFRQPYYPIEITVLSGYRNAKCFKLECLDKSIRVRLCARCGLCGSMLRMVTPSVIIPPGKDLIIN